MNTPTDWIKEGARRFQQAYDDAIAALGPDPTTVTATDEDDGYLVVRRGGEYVGEVNSTEHQTGDWYDNPIPFTRWHAAAVIVQEDDTREMTPAPTPFPSQARAVEWVARNAS